MYIDQLKKQHTEIARLTKELQHYTDAAAVTSKAAAIASTLSKLSGILSVHLAAEDKYLYPQLSKSEHPEVSRTAQAFFTDMGTLAPVYQDYKQRFLTASRIAAAPDAFLKDTPAVLGALSARLQKEDRELYPLVAE